MAQRLLLVALLLGALAAAGGCALVATGVAHPGPRDDGRSGPEREQDARIVNRLNDALVRDRQVRATAIQVGAYRGTVTLTGSVPDNAARERVLRLARGVDGVRQVVDRLRVVP